MNYLPFTEIKAQYGENKIPYSELLKAEEWRDKRQLIIQREKNICQRCNSDCAVDYIPVFKNGYVYMAPATLEEVEVEKKIMLRNLVLDIINVNKLQLIPQKIPKIPHVHHTYYLLGNLPWEYPDADLMLVCHTCHQEIHDNEIIKVYRNNKKFELAHFTPCSRCNGSGYLPEFDYHYNGICFQCNGACFEEWM